MRRLRMLAALAVAALSAACQSSPWFAPMHSPERLPHIIESQELRVGLTGSQPPLNMRNKQGEWMGLEVDVAQALARSMGLEVRFVELPFSDLIPALERDEVDLVISGMTITPERNARVAFAGPYFVSGKSVLTKSDTLARAAVEGRLDQKSRRFAALAGSTSEQFVKDVFPEATLVPVPEYNAGIQGVLDGSVDALIADYPICGLAVLRYPNAGLVALTTPFTIEPLGIALPASDPLWVNLVQNYLSTLENTGLLTRLHARWFSQGDWIDELP